MDPNQFIQTSEACQAMLKHVQEKPDWVNATMSVDADALAAHPDSKGIHVVVKARVNRTRVYYLAELALQFQIPREGIEESYKNNNLGDLAAQMIASAETINAKLLAAAKAKGFGEEAKTVDKAI